MPLGRTLIAAGLVLVAAGLLVTVLPLGRLPGDIRIQGKNGTFYFPVVTCILISALLSFAMWLIGRFRG